MLLELLSMDTATPSKRLADRCSVFEQYLSNRAVYARPRRLYLKVLTSIKDVAHMISNRSLVLGPLHGTSDFLI